MIDNEHIDELISKFLSGEALPDEAIILEEWKAESEQNRAYYYQCERVFNLSRVSASDKVDELAAWNKVSERLVDNAKIKEIKPKFSYLSIAAALIVLVGIGAAFLLIFKNTSSNIKSYATVNESQRITLEDKSVVTLAAHSELNFSSVYGKKDRVVYLKGEAYFDVKHDDAVPFIVNVGNVFIKDVGTKFDVRLSKDTDTVYVKVDEGIVLLFDSAGSELTIKATEKAVYVRSTKKIIKGNALSSSSASFDFNNNRLYDVLLEVGNKFNIPIKAQNKEIENCRITVQFNNESLENILGVITETLGFTYMKNSEGYLIQGEKCNN